MNKFLWFNRKFMAWGNPSALKDLFEKGRNQGFWESFGWNRRDRK